MFTLPRNTCNYSVPGTRTFRLGSSMITTKLTSPPREGKKGSNMQNWEKGIRRIFVSDGWDCSCIATREKLAHYLLTSDLSIFTNEERARIKILVQVDQAGAEALIVAYLCRHGNFRDLFINGIKSHVFVGLHVFAEVWKKEMANSGSDIKCDIDYLCSLPINQITSYPFWRDVDKLIKSSDKWPAERRYYYIAKQICHASNYGMKAGMFQLNTLEKSRGKIVISQREAENYLSVYHGLFSEIHEWHRQVAEQVTATRYLYNLFGYPRYFWYPSTNPNETLLKEMYAFPAQSTVGTITNIAYTRLQTQIENDPSLKMDLLGNTHDSYFAQVPIGNEVEAGKLMQSYINQELIAPSDGTNLG
jgi:hypothetical protein